MSQIPHSLLEFFYIQPKRAVLVCSHRALVHQVIELDRHAFAVSIIQSETQSAEHRCQIGRIKLPLRRVIRWQQLRESHCRGMIHHVLQREQAGNVGLRFFNRAVQLLQFVPGCGIPALDFDLMRSETVHQFVGHDVSEKRFEIYVDHRLPGEHSARDREQHATKLGFLNVSQHHPLAALLVHYTFIIGQIVCSGRDVMIAVSGAENLIDHHGRRGGSQFRIAVLGVNRQIVFDLLQVGGENREFLRFRVIAEV